MSLIEKIIKRFTKKKGKGGCTHRRGHNWKMQHDGWTTEGTNWNPNTATSFRGMTKKKIYYLCKRCGAHGYNDKSKIEKNKKEERAERPQASAA